MCEDRVPPAGFLKNIEKYVCRNISTYALCDKQLSKPGIGPISEAEVGYGRNHTSTQGPVDTLS